MVAETKTIYIELAFYYYFLFFCLSCNRSVGHFCSTKRLEFLVGLKERARLTEIKVSL